MAKKSGNKSKPNGKAPKDRRARKPVGHENGKRVSALRNRKADVTMTGPDGEVMFEGTHEEFKAAGERAAGRAAGRVTTFPSNGDAPSTGDVLPEKVSIGEAMRRAVEDLGEVVIDTDLAPSQLRQLADLYEDWARRDAAFNAKNEEAKTAKKSAESAKDVLLLHVKEFTHPKALPLFDGPQAVEDVENMQNAAAHIAASVDSMELESGDTALAD